MKKANNRYKNLTAYFTQEEWLKVKVKIGQSTCRSNAEFLRKLALGKPVRMFYRSKSIDDLVNECIALRKEMQAIREMSPLKEGNLEKLVAIQTEIKTIINKIADQCMQK